MDFPLLDKIDLKNIKNILNIAIIQDFIFRYQTSLLNGAIIIVTLIVVIFSLYTTRKQARHLKTQITDLEKKIEAISKQKVTLKELDDFIDTSPKSIPSNKLINLLTDLSVKRKVQIGSISPAKTVTKTLYNLTNLDLSVTANTYQDLGFFIYDIEHSPHAIRIEKWSASLSGRSSRASSQQKSKSLSGSQANEMFLTCDLTIGIIELKK